MSERPTPETDEATVHVNDACEFINPPDWEWVVTSNFAGNLERERDEAREELAKLRVKNDHNWQALADLEKITELAREQIAKANSERENDTQSELAAWELLKQTRELARELRDKLQLASDLLERAGREDATRWEPGQSWIFWEDKCAAKNDVQAIRGMLIKAKEVLS